MHKIKEKTALAVLLAVLMAMLFTGCDAASGKAAGSGAAQAGQQPSGAASGTGCTYDFPQTGFGFELPDGLAIQYGFLNPADVGEIDYGSGIMYGLPVYYNMTLEELAVLPDEDRDKVKTGYGFMIFCIKDAGSVEEAKEKLLAALEDEGDGDEDTAFLDTLKQIHEQDGYTWYSAMSEKQAEDFEGECLAEYNAFYDASEDIIANMKFCEPDVWRGSDAGEEITFETTDLNGNAISSDALFSRSKVTMINIWATTCGPCINEMAELQKLNEEFAGRGGAIVGVVADVPLGNNLYLEDAQDIINDTGVTYVNLRAWDGYDDVLSFVGTPTTYFVDSEGKLLGEPILGANVKAYEERLNAYLPE